MKRLQPLLLLLGLLFTNLGIGPCDDQPLGSTSGNAGTSGGAGTSGSAGTSGNAGTGSCTYNGTHYANGASFAAADGCNGCSCVDGAVGCTTRGCLNDAGSAGTVACDDGTGATDCCADPALTGTCSNENLSCWTRCSFASAAATDGFRGQKFCGGGEWVAGHGLFPCSRASSDGGATGTVACNDGTGATDCCADTSATGTCSSEGLTCWTRCSFSTVGTTDGYRGQKACSGGQWSAGKGLFPCTRPVSDGGTIDGSIAACTFGADQTCNDNPAVSSFWGKCQSNGACLCNAGREINPATGRCRLPQ